MLIQCYMNITCNTIGAEDLTYKSDYFISSFIRKYDFFFKFSS